MADRVRDLPLTMWAVFFLVQIGPRRVGRSDHRGRVRGRAELPVRLLLDRAVRYQDHRGSPLPPRRGDARSRRVPRPPGRSQPPSAAPAPRAAGRERRQRLRVRRSRRRDLPERVPAHAAGQRPGREPRRPAYGETGVSPAARPGRLEDLYGRPREWRAACGGQRSRAFAATGNPFAGDPLCCQRPAREQRLRPARRSPSRRRDDVRQASRSCCRRGTGKCKWPAAMTSA